MGSVDKYYNPEIHSNTSKWIAAEFVSYQVNGYINISEVESKPHLNGEVRNFIFVVQKNRYAIGDDDYEIVSDTVDILWDYYSADV